MALAYTSLWTNEDIKLESGFEFRCPMRNGSDKLANNHACAQTRDKGDRCCEVGFPCGYPLHFSLRNDRAVGLTEEATEIITLFLRRCLYILLGHEIEWVVQFFP